ncbi:hypothetical protein PG991_000770 [Apiospora marii]|uniref:Uncharacterized protein n=1 Tax=Apiospora marii TaxID=335849 RepID=A0ABR1SSY2_9PEZI
MSISGVSSTAGTGVSRTQHELREHDVNVSNFICYQRRWMFVGYGINAFALAEYACSLSHVSMRQAVAAKEKAQAEDRRREATAPEAAGEALAREEGTRLEREQQEALWTILYLGFTATCGDCAFFKLGARNETLESDTGPSCQKFQDELNRINHPQAWNSADDSNQARFVPFEGLVLSTASDAEGELQEDDPSLTRALTTDQRQRRR